MPFLALAMNENGKEHLEAGGGMKCSNFKGLYTETDVHISLAHISISICAVCTYIQGTQVAKQCSSLCRHTMPGWQRWEKCWDTEGCARSGTGEWLKSCVLSSCSANGEAAVLQVLWALRILCGSILGHTEDTEIAMR